ncbi:MAG: hypothetical protein ABIJ41_00845 [Candidatus Omnitrophota bacterium]
MKRYIDVHTGEIMAGRGEVILKSDCRSACLVIAAYDAENKIGGLAHAFFSKGKYAGKQSYTRILDTSGAIEKMIEDMSFLGAHKECIEICLVSAENVPHEPHDLEYDHNIAKVIDLLRQKHIRFRDDSSTDIGNHHVALDVGSGSVLSVN